MLNLCSFCRVARRVNRVSSTDVAVISHGVFVVNEDSASSTIEHKSSCFLCQVCSLNLNKVGAFLVSAKNTISALLILEEDDVEIGETDSKKVNGVCAICFSAEDQVLKAPKGKFKLWSAGKLKMIPSHVNICGSCAATVAEVGNLIAVWSRSPKISLRAPNSNFSSSIPFTPMSMFLTPPRAPSPIPLHSSLVPVSDSSSKEDPGKPVIKRRRKSVRSTDDAEDDDDDDVRYMLAPSTTVSGPLVSRKKNPKSPSVSFLSAKTSILKKKKKVELRICVSPSKESLKPVVPSVDADAAADVAAAISAPTEDSDSAEICLRLDGDAVDSLFERRENSDSIVADLSNSEILDVSLVAKELTTSRKKERVKAIKEKSKRKKDVKMGAQEKTLKIACKKKCLKSSKPTGTAAKSNEVNGGRKGATKIKTNGKGRSARKRGASVASSVEAAPSASSIVVKQEAEPHSHKSDDWKKNRKYFYVTTKEPKEPAKKIKIFYDEGNIKKEVQPDLF